jgi:hypothetical protein
VKEDNLGVVLKHNSYRDIKTFEPLAQTRYDKMW